MHEFTLYTFNYTQGMPNVYSGIYTCTLHSYSSLYGHTSSVEHIVLNGNVLASGGSDR